MKFEILYLPVGVPTFHLESAQREFDKSSALLRQIDQEVLLPDEMLLDLKKLNDFLCDKKPDLVFVQNVTFANGAYIAQALRQCSCPVLLWTLREPENNGGRLCLNSLTGALSSRCWPDFFTAFGTPVCAVLSILNDLGVSSACEADTYGALSMYMAQYLTKKSVFFGDPVSIDEKENSITFWHCGMAPCSLAREDYGACAGVHCNRKTGPTLEFGCKAEEKVTIFRVGRKAEGSFRFFISCGEALDKPQQFFGTSVVVKTKSNVSELVNKTVKGGWEPHFAMAMGDISNELEILADMLDIEVEN